MAVRAVFFDVGGVLEITPPTGWVARWERRLGLETGGLAARCGETFAGGSIGSLSEPEVHHRLGSALGLAAGAVDALMADMWTEYLGSANRELLTYMGGLRPRYAVGIISNSFVGAREREEARYGFSSLADVVVYSHEVGTLKPDAAIYRHACTALTVAPADAVLVDDWDVAVEGARAVGMGAVLFESNRQAIAAVEAML